MRVLVTGFERFGNVDINPSELIVRRLSHKADANVITEVLPVKFHDAGARIVALIHAHDPDAVLMLGVASARNAVNLERVALNVNDAMLPDNAGMLTFGNEIVPDGPVGYWSTLPLNRIKQVLEDADIRVRISNHAGAYVCNHVFYVAQHALTQLNKQIPCGFVHVPDIADESPGIPLNTLVKAVELCLQVLMEKEIA